MPLNDQNCLSLIIEFGHSVVTELKFRSFWSQGLRTF